MSTEVDKMGFWKQFRDESRTFHPLKFQNRNVVPNYWRAQYVPQLKFLKYFKKLQKMGLVCQLHGINYIFQIIASLCYGFAKAYLVNESFASLRNLPLGSYNVVNWVSLIPHF